MEGEKELEIGFEIIFCIELGAGFAAYLYEMGVVYIRLKLCCPHFESQHDFDRFLNEMKQKKISMVAGFFGQSKGGYRERLKEIIDQLEARVRSEVDQVNTG